MNARVGLWIDHRKALIVAITDKEEEIGLVISKIEKQRRGSPGVRPDAPHELRADDSRQKSLTEHLNIYYDAVIACIRDAESILIFGPGEAKGELKKRLQRDKLGARIASIEMVDKMTDHQIAARVRQHFQENVKKRRYPR